MWLVLGGLLTWVGVYGLCLALLVWRGLVDPDVGRRKSVWPMVGTLIGLMALALARTIFVQGEPLGAWPYVGCWLIIAMVVATGGRPVRLVAGSRIDPRSRTASVEELRDARKGRLLTMVTFAVGVTLAAVLRPDLFPL